MNKDRTTPLADTPHQTSVLVIKSFFREVPGSTVDLDSVRDAEQLLKQLRHDHGVCGSPDALPVIVMTEPDGDEPGNGLGTVAVAESDETRLLTIRRAIRCLEAVEAGLIEAGHVDNH